MFRKHFSKLIVLALAFSLFGCKDFIEKNISKDTPVLILPANNSTLLANPVHVKWEELEGATKYRIEIVSPEFANIQSFPLDSIVTGTNFYVGLDSAQYEIRITAMNAGYNSHTSEIKRFWVGTSQGGSNTGVVLTYPDNNEYYNESFTGKFKWDIPASGGVESYTFELHETNSFSGAYVISPINQLGNNQLTISEASGTALNDGVYCWGVKAYFSNGSETNFSKRVFYIDKTAPPAATLTTPANNSVQSSLTDVTFNWALPTDAGAAQSPRTSLLEISTNTNFSTLVSPGVFDTVTTRTVTLTSNTYYWRVRVKDEAGNEAPVPTTYYTLTVQ